MAGGIDEPDKNIRQNQLVLLYQNATANIDFSKRQQWWTTNQGLIALAALFLAYVQIKPSLGGCLGLIAVVITIVLGALVTGFAVWLINDLGQAADGERKRIEYIREEHFSKEFHEAWRQKLKFRGGTELSELRHRRITWFQVALSVGGLVIFILAVVARFLRAEQLTTP